MEDLIWPCVSPTPPKAVAWLLLCCVGGWRMSPWKGLRVTGSDTLCICQQIWGLLASLPAGLRGLLWTPFFQGLQGLWVRKDQVDCRQLGAVQLEHLPSGPQGQFLLRTRTRARCCQTLRAASCSCTLGRYLDTTEQAAEMSSEVWSNRGNAGREASLYKGLF